MKTTINYLLISFLFIMLTSCDSDSEISFTEVSGEIGFSGTSDEIITFFETTPEVFDALVSLGIDINSGVNPPDITGIFLSEPHVLGSTNIENDFEIGTLFADKRYSFSNYNPESRTLNFASQEINGEGQIISSAIGITPILVGSGNKFSLITITSSNSQGVILKSGVIISGTLDSSGNITNLQDAFIIIEKENDFNNDFIEVGQGRMFVDEDNITVRL